MKLPAVPKVNLVFELALLLLVACGLLSYSTTSALIRAADARAQSRAFLLDIEDTLSMLKDAETGQRGYLLTGEERYLKPYSDALRASAQKLEHIGELAKNLPAQRRLLGNLRLLVQGKLEELQQTITLRQEQGLGPALAVVRTDRGMRLMDDIRRVAGAMRSEASEQIREQDRNVEMTARRATFWIVLAGGLAALLVTLAHLLQQRDLARRRRAEESLARQAVELARSEAAFRDQTRILQSILDSMAEGVIVAGEDGKFLLFNPTAKQLLGLGLEDVSSSAWTPRFGLYLPDTTTPYPAADLPLSRALRGEAVQEAEVFVRHPGRPEGVWTSATARPLIDDRGVHRGGLVVIRDVSERKQAEQERIRLANNIRLLLDSTGEGSTGSIFEAAARSSTEPARTCSGMRPPRSWARTCTT